jgi:hypothetical protein
MYGIFSLCVGAYNKDNPERMCFFCFFLIQKILSPQNKKAGTGSGIAAEKSTERRPEDLPVFGFTFFFR